METNQTPQPQTPQTSATLARAVVLRQMLAAGVLNDETLPEARFTIFQTKPFREWPQEMQQALAPYGANLID